MRTLFLRMYPAKAKSLLRNEDGVYSIELALALPIFATMLIAILELGYYFFIASALENAVLHASRYGITGSAVNESISREDRVREIIAEQTFGQVKESGLNIETLVYQQFADIDTPEPYEDGNGNEQYDEGELFVDVNGNGKWDPDVGQVGLGGAGDIVLYRVTYQMDGLTGLYGWAERFTQIRAVVAVRNEPF